MKYDADGFLEFDPINDGMKLGFDETKVITIEVDWIESKKLSP